MKIFWVFIMFFVLPSVVVGAGDDEGQCIIENKECEGSTNQPANTFFDRETNEILEQIRKSVLAYVPCKKDDKCSCHSQVITDDLAPFQADGITKELIDSVATFGTKYQIIDHQLYRQKSCSFPSRCAGIEHFIKPLLNKLPNMEFIINCRDWPQLRRGHSVLRPVFSFSKTNAYMDIIYPAWAFWEGGPAISLHPTGIGRWDRYRNIISTAAKKWPWKEKTSKAFFRGSRTSDERDSLVLLSRRTPSLVDAQYTKNQAWKSPKDTLNAEPASEVSFENHCQYKYLFNFRGVSASFRLKHLFLCKSLVFHVGDEWMEFFYPALKPWVHFIPVKSYPSQEELESILGFFDKHDDLAQQIARTGYHFIWDHLRMFDVECYWEKLLTEYGKLVRYEVQKDESLKKMF